MFLGKIVKISSFNDVDIGVYLFFVEEKRDLKLLREIRDTKKHKVFI